MERVLIYRYRITLADGGLGEMMERILALGGTLEVTKYRHHRHARGRQLDHSYNRRVQSRDGPCAGRDYRD
ncbi:MAG: hypothetical protein ACRERD_22025 [Candidatus Binatia bacterium]